METAGDRNDARDAHPRAEPSVRIGAEAYVSPDYARAERDRLWRKVWLQAGRVEELPETGSYITYDIMDDSVIILRTAPDRIGAYHNFCLHRGRRLVDTPPGCRNASGKVREFRCGFHGWRYGLDGANTYVPDLEDWGGTLTCEDLSLRPVGVDTWGGWIWISLDPDIGPLLDYLSPIPEMLDPFGVQDMRYRWRRWGVFPCNWKVALEAFIEGYHVDATHPEFIRYGSYRSEVQRYGRHSTRGYAVKGGDGNRGKVRLATGGDPRVNTAEMVDFTMKHSDTNYTETLRKAALRLPDELPEGTPAPEVLSHWLASARRDDAARGVHWPEVDRDHAAKAGNTWQIFPNFKIGHAVSHALCYSARPYGADPDRCIFEAITLELYPRGGEPKAQWEFVPPGDSRWGSVLSQDFSNMEAVQLGMKSGAFPGTRPNPVQEDAIACLHDNLARYMGTGAPQKFG
jgi:phenylpropionate dioxygenase-like ring-hydroxylating dioxygenase large terminal subunit